MDELEGRILKARTDTIGYLIAISGDADLADDIFQDTCLQAWRAYGRFRPGSDFGAWLRGIARNCLLRDRRKRRRGRVLAMSEELMLKIETSWARQQRSRETGERRAALEDCLRQLPEERRELLRLRYNDHVPLPDLAAARGRSVDALKMFFLRCRQGLRRCIDAKLEQAGHEA